MQTTPPVNMDLAFAVYSLPARPSVLVALSPTLDLNVLTVLFSSGVVTHVAVDLTGSSIVMDKQPLGDGTVSAVSGTCPHFLLLR